jgi:hypothetical protein
MQALFKSLCSSSDLLLLSELVCKALASELHQPTVQDKSLLKTALDLSPGTRALSFACKALISALRPLVQSSDFALVSHAAQWLDLVAHPPCSLGSLASLSSTSTCTR